MPARERFAKLVDGGQLAFGHKTHERIDFCRRRNNARARTPALAPFGGDFENSRVAFVIREFFLPGFPVVTHATVLKYPAGISRKK
jgi:hypothetical protein